MNAQPKTLLKPGLLPVEKSKPSDKMSDYKWFIYGPPGIGKTTFANQFESPLILDFEGRTKHLECYSSPIGCWQDLIDVARELKTGNHNFKTLVIDTADLFYRLCQADICTKRKIEHPSDEAYGKGSDMVKGQLIPMIAGLQTLGMGMVFTSHMQEKTIKTRQMEYTKITTSLPPSAANIFLPLCDIVGYLHLDAETQNSREITFAGSDYVDAKKSSSAAVNLADNYLVKNDPNKTGNELSRELFNQIKTAFKGEK